MDEISNREGDVELIEIFNYEGVYGGRNSREEIVRALKEALALIENAPQEEFVCTAFRIEGIWR